MITDHVIFTSPYFEIEPGEDEDTNPGIYGKALAEWVATKLRERGLVVEGVIAEDFGRCVMVYRKPVMIWIGCANLEDSAGRWQMYIARERGLIARLRGTDGAAELETLRAYYRAILNEIPGVTDIEWQEA